MESTYFIVIQIDGTKSATGFQTAKSLHKQLKDIQATPRAFYIEELNLWQIYLFFAEPVKTEQAKTLVKTWLQNNWFDVDADATTVLPSGEPLQIPLQASFTWLNDELNPILATSEISIQNAVSMFLQDLRSNSLSFDTWQNILSNSHALAPAQSSLESVQNVVIGYSVKRDQDASGFDAQISQTISFGPFDSDDFVQDVLTKNSEQAFKEEILVPQVEPAINPVAEFHEENQFVTTGDEPFKEDSSDSASHFSGNEIEERPTCVDSPPESLDQIVPTVEEVLVHTREQSQQFSSGDGEVPLTGTDSPNNFEQVVSTSQDILDSSLSMIEIPSIPLSEEAGPGEFVQSVLTNIVDDVSLASLDLLLVPLDSDQIDELNFSQFDPLPIGSETLNREEYSFGIAESAIPAGEANKRAPPKENTAGKTTGTLVTARSTSSRDGPGTQKQSARKKSSPKSDFNTFEQLTLPFGINTS